MLHCNGFCAAPRQNHGRSLSDSIVCYLIGWCRSGRFAPAFLPIEHNKPKNPGKIACAPSRERMVPRLPIQRLHAGSVTTLEGDDARPIRCARAQGRERGIYP